MERFAADLDGFVEGTEAERTQRVEERPGVADAEVEATQMRPQAEVVTLDVEQRGGLHTARALAHAGGEPAPVGESPLAGRQRVTRGVPPLTAKRLRSVRARRGPNALPFGRGAGASRAGWAVPDLLGSAQSLDRLIDSQK